ncbi:hypothetical protein [Futiania mangrovi]|uniref:Uncharacterized protein n=1 Tax=Futiania mangrovi TaxID=2959716 RepID=A0A9J6PIC7_9PROT|nr:hypothetical protein [Futiania mangrovii]MCP1337560.1 hypothetical protein [Futiania mangrovii]
MTVTDFASSASWGYTQNVDPLPGDFSAAYPAPASATVIAAEDPSLCQMQLEMLERQMGHIASEMASVRAAQRNGDDDALRMHLNNVRGLASAASNTCYAFEAMCSDPSSGLSEQEIQKAKLLCDQIERLGQRADRLLMELDQKGANGIDLQPMMNLLSNIADGIGGLLAAFGGALGWFLQQLFRRPGAV